MLGRVAQVLAEGESLLDPGERTAGREAPGLEYVIAVSEGGVGHQQPTVARFGIGQLGDRHGLNMVKRHQIVVTLGSQGVLSFLFHVPWRVGHDRAVELVAH